MIPLRNHHKSIPLKFTTNGFGSTKFSRTYFKMSNLRFSHSAEARKGDYHSKWKCKHKNSCNDNRTVRAMRVVARRVGAQSNKYRADKMATEYGGLRLRDGVDLTYTVWRENQQITIYMLVLGRWIRRNIIGLFTRKYVSSLKKTISNTEAMS